MNKIFLLSCGAKKRNIRTTSQNMYIGNYFNAQKKYAKIFGDDFYILSAKYGLLNKNDLIYPYEHKLNSKEIVSWSSRVADEIKNTINIKDEIYILAGYSYTRYLIPLLKDLGYCIHLPLKESKGMGYSLQIMLNDIEKSYKV